MEIAEDTVEALRRPEIYDDCSTVPQVIETHISTIFLTDGHVYKLKKPVNFGFLDYSTIEKRRLACDAELECNRRLAPEVYLRTVAIGKDARGQWRIGDDVEPMDWLVQMKRLPENRCLTELLNASKVSETEITQITEMLSRFYRFLDPAPITPADYRCSFFKNVTDNHEELALPRHSLSPTMVRFVHAAQLQFFFLWPEVFDRRVKEGRVVEGHGDLRAEHIYLTHPPVVIDGVEFSRAFRTIDIADELCFFEMTCEFLGAGDVGRSIRVGCSEALKDQPDERILDFYRVYRCCVRAKVEALRTDQVTGNAETTARRHAESYLKLAELHAKRLGRPLAIIVRGLSGSGKTTFARHAATSLAAVHLSTDQTRKSGSEATAQPSYDQAARRRIYDSMIQKGEYNLREGASIILDGTFLTSDVLNEAADALLLAGASVAVVTCTCPDRVAIERIAARNADPESLSDANADVFYKQRDLLEPVAEKYVSAEIDTTAELDVILNQLRDVVVRSLT